jgi:hypothetical protein
VALTTFIGCLKGFNGFNGINAIKVAALIILQFFQKLAVCSNICCIFAT